MQKIRVIQKRRVMQKRRVEFCSILNKNVCFVERSEILPNGNGPDRLIGEAVCNHDCPIKETCKFARSPINRPL